MTHGMVADFVSTPVQFTDSIPVQQFFRRTVVGLRIDVECPAPAAFFQFRCGGFQMIQSTVVKSERKHGWFIFGERTDLQMVIHVRLLLGQRNTAVR